MSFTRCSKSSLLILCLVTVFVLGCAAQKNDQSAISISLSNFNPVNSSSQLFSTKTNLDPDSNLIINVVDVPSSLLQFFIIQIHSFQVNTLLSSNQNFITNSYVNGTNIGLVQKIANSGVNSYKFYLKNEDANTNDTILIVVTPYVNAPIPGGCSMEFMTEIAPYQRLTYSDAVITVDAQSASMPGYRCEKQIVKHEMYHLYLPESDFSLETYHDGIMNMLTVTNITTYGTKVSKSIIGYLRQMYSAYKGTGSVYVLVASVNNSKSAYVPIVSYACDIHNWPDSCFGPSTIISKVLCGMLVFLGLFTCYYGHRFFKTEMFLVGSLVGAYASFLIISVFDNMNERDTIIVSLVIGSLIGGMWLAFWWFCGIPIFTTLLYLFILGFLLASIVFYAGLGDLVIVHNDITYWGFFTSLVLMCMIVLSGFMHNANIASCAIVGSYAVIIPLDHYCGSSLKYIFINTLRRATVDDFRMAVIDPPYQMKDLWLTLLWVSLAVTGTVYQCLEQEGRPPFPPAPARSQPPDERTPLLRPTSSASPADRIILIHSTPSDV